MESTTLVTGVAGFIGSHVTRHLLDSGSSVVGVDNLNSYYSIDLKKARLDSLKKYTNFTFLQIDLADPKATPELFLRHSFKRVIHLAAQAGVRYSIDHPHAYIESNILGFLNTLEGCRHQETKPHLVYASSSSVYGLNSSAPFSEDQRVDHPISLYAATKKSNELMAHSYSHLYQFPTTGLRYFTVYGPWGRPDMAYFSFTKAIFEGTPIRLFNHGKMNRDFTYIDDVVVGTIKASQKPATPNESTAPYRIFNIGNHQSVNILDFIKILEKLIRKKAVIVMDEMQPGDVTSTEANVDRLNDWIGFQPNTPIEIGLEKFVIWYRSYFKT